MKGNTQHLKGVHMEDPAPHSVYAGAGSEVAKEARSKTDGYKRGGAAHHHDDDDHEMKRKPRKRGGKAMHDMHVHGEKSKHKAHRKPRMSGGQVMSSAHKGTMRPGFQG